MLGVKDRCRNMMNNNNIILTFDTDWCPDYMIEYVLQKLEKYNVSQLGL